MPIIYNNAKVKNMSYIDDENISRLGTQNLPLVKQVSLFFTGWVGFQILGTILRVIIVAIFSNVKSAGDVSSLASILINSLAYIFLLIALISIINIDIFKLLESFKQYQSYIAAVICVVAIFAFNILYNILIKSLYIPIENNANEESLQSIEKVYPFVSVIVFGFIGPICEEITYRVGLFSSLRRKSRIMAYFITIIVFAFIHFNWSTDTRVLLNEVLNLPFYMFAAAAFSFVYDKYGFAASTTAHILNNLISILLVSYIH